MSGSGNDRNDFTPASPVSPTKSTTGGGGLGGGGAGDDPCDIVQTAPLNSPVPAVVSGLSVGDLLDVFVQGSPPRSVLALRTSAGLVAGSLTHAGHLQVVRCIGDGHAYQAEVVQVTGGTVLVRVSRT